MVNRSGRGRGEKENPDNTNNYEKKTTQTVCRRRVGDCVKSWCRENRDLYNRHRSPHNYQGDPNPHDDRGLPSLYGPHDEVWDTL